MEFIKPQFPRIISHSTPRESRICFTNPFSPRLLRYPTKISVTSLASTQPSSTATICLHGLCMSMSQAAMMSDERLSQSIHVSSHQIFTPISDSHRRTRIVATLGPSCWDRLDEMIDAGMNVARFNFSHGDVNLHRRVVENLRQALERRPNSLVALLLDTKGPEIRTGFLKEKVLKLTAGQLLKITTDYGYLGDSDCISCSYEKLCESVDIGGTILIADGSVSCQVESKHANYIIVKVRNDATLGERKNMNLPNVKVDLPCIGEKEIQDINEFGIPFGVQFIAVSFVQAADDLIYLRNILGEKAKEIKLIAKIENVEGLMNFDEILNVADGIMIARGDMGMEIPPQKVFIAQKMMIRKCNLMGKPVITATQMLESMTVNPRPTRAEVADVANAVIDGTDCVMLSGETANGKFPIEAVQVMASICSEAESCIDYSSLYRALHKSVSRPVTVQEAVCYASVSTAIDVNASVIVVLTETGMTAQFVAKYRPKQFILALSDNKNVLKQLQMIRGVKAVRINSFDGTNSLVDHGIALAKNMGLVQSGGLAVCLHGVAEKVSGGTDIMKVVHVK